MLENPYTLIEHLIERMQATADRYDIEKVKEAYLLAYRAHQGQFRQSGEPYITHPISVAESVLELGLDTDTLCALTLL